MSTLHQIREFGQLDTEPEPINIVNKRGFDPEAEESERLAKRKELKEHIARLRLASQRQSELQLQRRQLDQQLDQLAADHEQRLEGVQSVLSVIEKRMIGDISQGRSTNPDDEQQRRELLHEIDSANVELQRSLKEVRERIPIVDKALREILPTAAQYQASQSDLWARHVAHPELFKQYVMAKNRSDWASRRIQALSSRLGEIQDEIDQNQRWQKEQQGVSYSKEISRWQTLADDVRACLSDASSEQAESRAASDAARQAIIQE